MYKTVRQGENCLQYHILPQDDTSSGHSMKRRRSTRNRTALVLVVTLILGCAIIAAAVLIPVLMHANVVALPARFQTFAVAASSINMKGRGKYTLQGTQYIALLPVKDSSGHFNAYQLKPSFLTTTSTSPPTTEVLRIAKPEMSDTAAVKSSPSKPLNLSSVTRGEIHRLGWPPNPYLPWMDHTRGALVLGVGVVLFLLIITGSLGLCLYVRRRQSNARRDVEKDKDSLLAEAPVEED